MSARKTLFTSLAALSMTFMLASANATIVLPPNLAGSYATGSGASATFLKVDDQWHGSSVLWNEASHTFGNGTAISQYGWGTGIWGISDWNTLTAAGSASSAITASWSGVASQINFGNDIYNNSYSSTWGAAAALPNASMQTNWLADFSGYIRITEAGLYNFSVLYDDGFFFNLYGADGQEVSMSQDFINPRDREGFDDNLLLGVGLYKFDLGSYNRLEAGVVDLRWMHVGVDQDWSLVPTENLVNGTPQPLPEPGSLALMLPALLSLALMRLRRT